jgi:hypothetical protein
LKERRREKEREGERRREKEREGERDREKKQRIKIVFVRKNESCH